jgi:hypothetical protein
MTLLNDADKIYLGLLEADAVYAGATKVWPAVSAGPTYSLLVSYTPGDDRNDFDGEVGVRLGIGTANIPITWIGARCNGIGGTRTVKLTEWSTDTLHRTVIIDYSGKAAGEYAWTAIAPFTLLANNYYALMMVVTAWDGQTWTNPGPTSFTSDIINVNECYRHLGTAVLGGVPNQQFVGFDLGWDAPPPFVPTDISGLSVWLDASQLGLADGANVNGWPNLGSGTDAITYGTPPVLRTAMLNGKPVVRFSAGQGIIYGTSDCAANYTVLYVSRRWGATAGRSFSSYYPTATNFLVGCHDSMDEVMYDDAGWVAGPSGVAWGTPPGPWKMYEADSTTTPSFLVRFLVDGVVKGSVTSGAGMAGYYVLSGFDITGSGETMDCDTAEVLLYNRKLADAERIQVEDYLREKWGLL